MITGQNLLELVVLDASSLTIQDVVRIAENSSTDVQVQLAVSGYLSQRATAQVVEVLDVLDTPSWEVTQYLKRGCKDFGKKSSRLDGAAIELLLSQCRQTRIRADRASNRSRHLKRETLDIKAEVDLI